MWVNNLLFSFLKMSELFQSDIFHMGGDEVKMDCWNETQEIVDWLAKKGYTEQVKLTII